MCGGVYFVDKIIANGIAKTYRIGAARKNLTFFKIKPFKKIQS